jgi:osmotically-inducible protein OsmY
MDTNSDLQKDVQEVIMWQPLLNAADIEVTVKDGVVSLTGVVDSLAKKLEVEGAAKDALITLIGIKGITNNITIKSLTINTIGKEEIDSALKRCWLFLNNHIEVEISGHHVKLSGTVCSLHQKEEASRIVWNILGVWSLNNELVVEYDYVYAN